MVAAISLLVAIMLSILITRVATVALTLTGLSKEVARFQARSALTGAGFTTSETEKVLNHPVRRRIIMFLILVGSAGLASVVATLILSFTGTSGGQAAARGGFIVLGLVVLIVLARSRLVDRWLSRAIERALRRFTTLDVRDYASLLRLTGNWSIAELEVRDGDWVAGRTLAELDLPHEGLLVLGIERRDGRWVGAPKGTAALHAGDTVYVYGMEETVADLDARPKDERGERDREAARRRYQEHMAQQEGRQADDDPREEEA